MRERRKDAVAGRLADLEASKASGSVATSDADDLWQENSRLRHFMGGELERQAGQIERQAAEIERLSAELVDERANTRAVLVEMRKNHQVEIGRCNDRVALLEKVVRAHGWAI